VLYVDRATILQHETSKVGKVNTESLAKPAIMRAGADGKCFFSKAGSLADIGP
jgi:talin